MKATEVRIGNYVYDTKGEINKINLAAIAYLLREESSGACQVKPIPLTEELLKKCGFDVHPYDDNSGNGKTAELEYLIKTKNTPEGYCQSFSMDKGNNWEHWTYNHSGGDYEINAVNIEIKSLHQLQNLYFALTGEELEIVLSDEDDRYFTKFQLK